MSTMTHPPVAERSQSVSGPTVLVEGSLLSGEALLEYAQQKGLCTKCLQHTTHTRARKRLGMLRYTSEWLPVTSTDAKEGNYTVYKGYCLQPTCWTLEQVQLLLGERPLIKSASKGRVMSSNRTPTRTRDVSDEHHDSNPNIPSTSRTERSPGGSLSTTSPGIKTNGKKSPRPRHPVADLLHDRDNGGSAIASGAHLSKKSPTNESKASLASESDPRRRQPVKASTSDSSLDFLHYHHPRRKVAMSQTSTNSGNETSSSANGMQSSGGTANNAAATTEDRKVRKKKVVPDIYVVQQLCKLMRASSSSDLGKQRGWNGNHSGVTTANSNNNRLLASDTEFWTTLYTRYGQDTWSIDTRQGKIMTLLRLLKLTDGTECYEPTWILLQHITKQTLRASSKTKGTLDPRGGGDEQPDPSLDGFVRKILVGISTEFDRDMQAGGSSHAKKLAALSLYNMLKAEEHSYDSHFLGALQAMSRSRRQRWIAVLLDTLMFQDEEQGSGNGLMGSSVSSLHASDETAATTEILYVVWNLLVSQPGSDRDSEEYAGEEGLLMQTIVGIIMSILSSECEVVAGSSSTSMITGSSSSVLLSETALGLLATVVSRGGAIALSGRQFECLQVIFETMVHHQSAQEHDVYLQGANATCHILTHFRWLDDTFSEKKESNSGQMACFVEQLVHVVRLTLQYETEHGSSEFSAATCRLLTVLLEADKDFIQLVLDSDFMQGPSIVQSLLRMLDTGADIGVVESASDILVFLTQKVSTNMAYVRQTEHIATLLIRWIKTYETSPFVQQQICLIIEHIVETEDPTFGREIGMAGGLTVMGDFLLVSAAREGPLIEIASRVLVGILASVDSPIYQAHQDLLMEVVVTSLSSNMRILELQMALMEVLQCMLLRTDCLSDKFDTVISVVVASADNHLSSPHLLSKCCTILRLVSLLTHDWSVVVRMGAAKMITGAIMIHPTSTEFVLEAMATLKDLASNDVSRDCLDLVEAETAVVSLFSVAKDNPEFLSLAFATLNNIAVDSRSRIVAPMKTFVLNMIVWSLDHFAAHADVVRSACLLLKSYTYDACNLEMMQQSIDDILPLLEKLPALAETGETRDRVLYILGKL